MLIFSMRITAIQSEARAQRINSIIATLKQAALQSNILDFNKFLDEICLKISVSRRTAREYLRLAITFTNSRIETQLGKLVIIPGAPNGIK